MKQFSELRTLNESKIVEKSEAWVLVQNRKIIKKFKTKPSNSAFTSSDNQTLMTVSKAAKMGINESVELDEAMGKLNAKGEIEMTAKNYAKVHKDYKTKMQGVPYAMQIDPKTGGSALYPVKIIKESVEVVEGDEYKNISKTITQTPKHKRDKKATAAKPAKTNAREVARRKAIEKHQARSKAKKDDYWDESVEESSGMTAAQKKKFDTLYKKMDGGKEHMAIKQKVHNPIKADDAFHALVKKMAMESIDESAKGMVGGFTVEIPKQTISGKTIGGGKNGIFVKAKTSRQAISMAAKRLGVDFKMLKVGKVLKESTGLEEGKMKEFHDYIDQGKSAQWIAKKMGLDMKTVKELMADMKESVEEGKTGAARLTNRLKKSGVDLDKRAKDRAASHAELKKKYATESVELDEAYQQFLDKTPNWGEDKAISYGRKKGYKEIGVCGHGKIDGIVLFGLDAGDKSYVGKEAKVKTGQTVFRYATSRTVAGDIFPLVKIDVKKGLLYNLSQKSSEGEIEHAEFETKSSKLRYLRLLSTANLRDIVGFDAEVKESTAPKTLSDIRAKRF